MLEMLKASIPPEKLTDVYEGFNDGHFIKDAGRVMIKHKVDACVMYEMLASFLTNNARDWNEPMDPLGTEVNKRYMDAMDAYDENIKVEAHRKYAAKRKEEDSKHSREMMERARLRREEIRQRKAEKKEERCGLTLKEFKEKKKAEREMVSKVSKKQK